MIARVNIEEWAKISSSAEIIKLIERDGWLLKRISGSHHHFTHPIKPGIVTVAHPKKDIPPGTLGNILRQAGLKGEV